MNSQPSKSTSSRRRSPLRVLIAGGGVAGLEALLALRDLAGERVRLTLLSPAAEFVYRPMAVAEPFGRGRAAHHDLHRITEDVGAELLTGALAGVDEDGHVAVSAAGERLSYDALLVAVGAGSEPAFRGVLSWTPETDPQLFGGLLRDLDEGYVKRVAFIVPPGVAWVLPAYELALMTGWQAWGMGHDDVQVTVYTPEDAPLGLFGAQAAAAVRDDLEAAGVKAETGVYVAEDPGGSGRLILQPGERELDAERSVALPRAVGPGITGLPSDPRGFVLTDRYGKVPDAARVWAAGDAIAFPVKQGGLASQQADAAAESIAALAGADVEPEPFRPMLRGMMLTGRGRAWMRHGAAEAPSEGIAFRRALWWPPTKTGLSARRGGACPPGSAARRGQAVGADRREPTPAVRAGGRGASPRAAAASCRGIVRVWAHRAWRAGSWATVRAAPAGSRPR
ncbi:MAG TPA: FAD-dependent oxidoreductase [Solirubrobacteraceae bacterium]|nr:FAD-dependent oxidoreductase [Solirubrobacteraceae bacterium]